MKHVSDLTRKSAIVIAVSEEGKLEAGDYAEIFGTLDDIKSGIADLKEVSGKGEDQ